MRMCILTEAREDVGILSQGFSLSLKLLVLDRLISQQGLSISTPTSNIRTTGISNYTWFFCVGAGVSNTGPQTV